MACILILSVSSSLMAAEETETVAALKLEQIISREAPKCNCARASLTIGRDGMVYLTSAGQDTGYILCVSRDGRDKLRAAAVPAIHNAAADTSGLIVGSHAHFSHLVAFYNK